MLAIWVSESWKRRRVCLPDAAGLPAPCEALCALRYPLSPARSCLTPHLFVACTAQRNAENQVRRGFAVAAPLRVVSLLRVFVVSSARVPLRPSAQLHVVAYLDDLFEALCTTRISHPEPVSAICLLNSDLDSREAQEAGAVIHIATASPSPWDHSGEATHF